MESALLNRVNVWKKLLLDFGKRNRLINFKETKRSNVKIITPSFGELYDIIAIHEKCLDFPFAKKIRIDENGEESYDAVIPGDIETTKPLGELQKTLKALRYRAKTSIEEQGINTLYLAFGLLKWTESDNSEQVLISPLVLVPARLTIESLTSPYVISAHEDEIVVNPTLSYKLQNDFGIIIPDFDSDKDSIETYLDEIEKLIENKGWTISRDVNLTILSFLKINMFKDLERNEEKLDANNIVTAIAGESEPISIPEELNNYDHDKKTKLIDTFQVVDADSSQQDAVLLSKNGISFVLQGPPGTGKSQTITNIISEALANGKKVLFVSEKMAALQVVYKRLTGVGLSDFCFTLHSHKANKKEILRDLATSLTIDRKKVREEALTQLETLQRKRDSLNDYQNQLHTNCSGLNCTIYNVNGKLAKLDHVPEVIFEIVDVDKVTQSELNDRTYLLSEFSKTVGKRSEDYKQNVWRNSNVEFLSNELRHDIDSNISLLTPQLEDINIYFEDCCKNLGLSIKPSLEGLDLMIQLLSLVGKSPMIPIKWIYSSNIEHLFSKAEHYKGCTDNIVELDNYISERYNDVIFSFDGKQCSFQLSNLKNYISGIIKSDDNNLVVENLAKHIVKVDNELSVVSELFSKATEIATSVGIDEPKNLSDVKFIIALSQVLSVKIAPTELWFDEDKLSQIKNEIANIKDLHDNIISIERNVCKKYEKGVFGVDFQKIIKLHYQEISHKIVILQQLLNKDWYHNQEIILSKNEDIHSLSVIINSNLVGLRERLLLVSEIIGVNCPNTSVEINKFIFFAKSLTGDFIPTDYWFEKQKLNQMQIMLTGIIEKDAEIKSIRNKILIKFDKEIFGIDHYSILQRFRSRYTSIFRNLNKSYKADLLTMRQYAKTQTKLTYDAAVSLLNDLKQLSDIENDILSDKDNHIKYFGTYYNALDTQWDDILRAINDFNTLLNTYPEIETIPNIKELLIADKLPKTVLLELLSYYSSNNINARIDEYKNLSGTTDFSIEHVIHNLDVIIKTTSEISDEYEKIWNDIKPLCRFDKISDFRGISDVFDLLTNLKTYADKREEIENNKATYQSYFGSYYNGLDTDWDKIEDEIDKFQNIISQFPSGYVPRKLKVQMLSQTLPYAELNELCRLYTIHPSESIVSNLHTLITTECDEQTQYSYISQTLNSIVVKGKELIEIYNKINNLRRNKTSVDELLKDLNQLTQMQTLSKEMEEQKQEITEQYAQYYSGIKTDWAKTFDALMFAKEFKEFINKTHLPETFIEKVCSDAKVISYCKTSAAHLATSKEKMRCSLKWVLALFNESEQLSRYYFKDLCERIISCKNKKYLLEEWVDYRSNRRKCEETGLSSYIEQVEDKSIDTNYIVDAYLKRFYRLWLDAILPHFPAVQSFRGRVHEQTIKEFQDLDCLQFKIAQARVRERVCSRIPDFDSITSTRDEINILKRELNKQRRLMPLRKLFMAIPNLLTAIRPCFMMSPLSVSVFLEAKSYDFDMVIFDEASQVHTEDAIGAIMRGKQVIIVGDTKQLPPTSFFASSLEDEDFDTDVEVYDEKDNDAGAYQSILEESVVVLPERSLRWHYRSRDEHLIAFSNIKIYNNSLITFPSSIEKAPDVGVEYVYVSNGIYDRGSKRNNIIEAKKVAELVFNHFRKHPDRSLGVVTFSEAQQQAVDAAIKQERLQNGMFEQYFNEDREEPFFIKNLENVQGDERDTIIFSIGYAKDNNGMMYMNFGPLSKDGGYRRLNVAITRAKFNVKLVGSIMPTDIDIEKTSAEGVRLLRSYIEYAQQGIVALQKELSYIDSLEFDSPFEEAVYNYLSEKGYEVKTQVGCSGFRIDMAVKHPKHSGQFALGIECDGAAYHSSRTARERDRLRQTVLEDMGWTIYRIWSTDWIKDQITEEQKLVNAIDRALSKVVDESYFEEEDIDNNDTSISTIEIVEGVDISEISFDNGCDFIPYTLANISEYQNLSKYEVIFNVIEIEQPIHFEELCRRVAPLFGNYKVTSKVRDGVEAQIRWHLAEFITRKGEFITLNDFNNLQVRVPAVDSEFIRPINYISDEELGLAMMVIAKKSFGITPDDLYVTTAREFGFKRTGENIVSSLRQVYDKILNIGRLKEVDGKVNII